MSREIPFFELFAQLQLSPELRLKLLGTVIASACIHQDTLSMELAMIVKHPLEPSDLDELNSAIRNGYGLNEVRFRVTLKEEQLPSQWKAAAAPSAPSGGGPSGPVHQGQARGNEDAGSENGQCHGKRQGVLRGMCGDPAARYVAAPCGDDGLHQLRGRP